MLSLLLWCLTLMIKNIYNIIKVNVNISVQRFSTSYCFSLPFILSKINIDSVSLDTEEAKLAYGLLLISLVALFCFINVIGFILSYVLLQKGDYESKYPKLKKNNSFI